MALGNVVFKAGFDAEDRVINILKTYDCRLEYGDADLDHNQKLDFIVNKLPEIPTRINLGVQVTTNLDSASKMDDFLRVNRDHPASPRSLYVELGNGVDLERGGGLTVLLAIGGFAQNRKTSEGVGAVRIHPDLTYEFFNLADRIKELRGGLSDVHDKIMAAKAGATAVTPTQVSAIAAAQQINHAIKHGTAGMQVGELSDYNTEKGFGYIQESTGKTFFMHMNYVEDALLKTTLKSLNPNSGEWVRNVRIPVRFKNVGITKPGMDTPTAQEIVSA